MTTGLEEGWRCCSLHVCLHQDLLSRFPKLFGLSNLHRFLGKTRWSFVLSALPRFRLPHNDVIRTRASNTRSTTSCGSGCFPVFWEPIPLPKSRLCVVVTERPRCLNLVLGIKKHNPFSVSVRLLGESPGWISYKCRCIYNEMSWLLFISSTCQMFKEETTFNIMDVDCLNAKSWTKGKVVIPVRKVCGCNDRNREKLFRG